MTAYPHEGLQKIANLTLALAPDRARQVLARMDEAVTPALRGAVAGKADPRPEHFDRACREFLKRYRRQIRNDPDPEPADGEEAATDTPARGSGTLRAGDDLKKFLANTTDETLASYLRSEYPQTIAVVLSLFDPAIAARVAAQFPEDLTVDVLLRLAQLEPVKEDLRMLVESALKQEIYSSIGNAMSLSPPRVAASILNNLDSERSSKLLSILRARSTDVSEQIEAHMFTFNDFLTLSPESMATVTAAIDKEVLCMALKGVANADRARITASMSNRATKAFEQRFAELGKVKTKDVNEARSNLLGIIRTLIAEGQLDLDDEAGAG